MDSSMPHYMHSGSSFTVTQSWYSASIQFLWRKESHKVAAGCSNLTVMPRAEFGNEWHAAALATSDRMSRYFT